MNIEEAKKIPITDYLHSLGYSPVKQQGANLWYKSPLREEHEASFKVNTEREQWYDFGAGKGGNIIALAQELYCSDHLPYLLNRIAEQAQHVRPVSFSFRQQRSAPSFQHLKVRDLTHRHYSVTCRGVALTSHWQKENAGNCISPMTASPTLPSVSRMWLAATRCATPFSKAASHRKTSPISGKRANQGRSAWCSRASWTIFHSSR